MNTKNSLTLTKKYRLILSAVHMVYRLVNSTYNVEEMTLRLTRLLCQFIQASSSTIYILDPSQKKIILKAVFNNKINILVTKKRELAKITKEEKKVLAGFTYQGKTMIGIPLVADDNVGAICVKRTSKEPPFSDFDKELLSVVAEQSVTAIKNLQLYDEQQKVILGSIKFIGNLLERQGHASMLAHTPTYFKIVKTVAEKMHMSQTGIDCLYYASVLRATGAIDVPYDILSKSSRLSPEEFKIIRNQPAKSVELIRPVEFLKPVLPIILYHHEKYDGTGYPSGLKKEQIPLGARIMSLVDAFEAMTLDRPYKTRYSMDDAITELKRNSGTQFDPKVVDTFVELSRLKKFRNFLSSINQ